MSIMATSCLADSEAVLVRQAALGSAEAFSELVTGCTTKIYRVSLRLLKNQADAEDNVQNTLWKAFKKMGQFKGESRFSTWMVRIATNEALMAMRRRRSRRDGLMESIEGNDEQQERIAELTDTSANPERQYLVRELAAKALGELPASLKDAYLLQKLEGWTNRELAARDRISPQTMKSRMFRAKTLLSKRLSYVSKGAAATPHGPVVS
jgi:RNA polymerase sigma-70 factor, ECF subfamily